jgi:hypothetical protein
MPYLVFVDESFRGFFELDRRGYFVHATVGIPEGRYQAIKDETVPVFAEFRRLTTMGAAEFKHGEFKRIAYRDRRKLAFRLRDIFKKHGAFLAGFYTPVAPFVLEHVRSNLFLDDQEEVPANYEALYREAETEIRGYARGPGQSAIISRLLHLAVGGVANMLASFGCPFTVVYDPRERKEDRAVIRTVDGYLAMMENFKHVDTDLRSDLKDFAQGFVHDRRSEDELGLQLADLIAGEVREFFVANRDLMEHGASSRLITATSWEPIVTTARLQGKYFKTGAVTRMTPGLQRRFLRQDPQGRTVLPIFRELLAAGILTCYSSWGQPRDLVPFERIIWDQLE